MGFIFNHDYFTKQKPRKIMAFNFDSRYVSCLQQIKRDYDEEEKGFGSGSEKDREVSETRSDSPPTLEAVERDSDHQAVDMDMSD